MNGFKTLLRESAHRWVETASLEELAKVLPDNALVLPRAVSINGEGGATFTITRSRTVPKRLTRTVTPGDAEVIRQRLGKLDRTSKDYARVRDELCRELRLTRRQVGCSLP